MENNAVVNVKLWLKSNGNLQSHGEGLSAENVAALQALKPGDRLVIFKETSKRTPSSADYTLRKDRPRTETVAPSNSSGEVVTSAFTKVASASSDSVA